MIATLGFPLTPTDIPDEEMRDIAAAAAGRVSASVYAENEGADPQVIIEILQRRVASLIFQKHNARTVDRYWDWLRSLTRPVCEYIHQTYSDGRVASSAAA